jgi:DedD protein
MGLLSIFQRKKTAADPPAPAGRGTKARAAARPAPAANVSAPADAAEAVREARARARRRLMGATVLLLIGVIGFPLLFETQPRPIPVDLPIEIPARNGAGALDAAAMPAPAARGTRAAPGGTTAAAGANPASETESVSYDQRPSAPTAPVAAAASRAPAAEPAPVATPPARAAAPVAAASKPAAAAQRSAQAEAPATPVPSASSTAAAAALLGTPEAASGTSRYIVQLAAFRPSDDAKIHDIRGKVEKLGLKTYTQPVDTPGGKMIRLRVGPYATKSEADAAVAKIAAAGLGVQPKVYLP